DLVVGAIRHRLSLLGQPWPPPVWLAALTHGSRCLQRLLARTEDALTGLSADTLVGLTCVPTTLQLPLSAWHRGGLTPHRLLPRFSLPQRLQCACSPGFSTIVQRCICFPQSGWDSSGGRLTTATTRSRGLPRSEPVLSGSAA